MEGGGREEHDMHARLSFVTSLSVQKSRSSLSSCASYNVWNSFYIIIDIFISFCVSSKSMDLVLTYFCSFQYSCVSYERVECV